MPLDAFKAEVHRICTLLHGVPRSERMAALKRELEKMPSEQRDIALALVTVAVDVAQQDAKQENMKTAMPLFILVVVFTSIISLACVGGGIYAIAKGSFADTKFDMFGVHLSTGHVGIAFTGVGLIVGFFTIRAVLNRVSPK